MGNSVEQTFAADAEHTVEVGPAGGVDAGRQADPPEPEVGARLGRYVLVSVVGRGGMGQVMRGYDPKLRREVAIKLLRSGSEQLDDARKRMIREAQAMARLSHPNIVAVYDVDELEGQSFIAMEFVGGQTLSKWLLQRRSSKEVLQVMEQAGRGLAAAHEAGVVHRDFKPSNVMLGEDGRARVTDFGIAHTGFEILPSEEALSLGDEDGTELTRTGSVVGTPPYMAPEVHAGERGDVRSDVYAFCVTFWEALYGRRPFEAPYEDAKLQGPPAPPQDAEVPVWLHRLVARGLQPEPTRRFTSMKELLAALRKPTRTWRRRAVVGTVLLGAGSVVGVQSLIERQHRLACKREGEAIGQVWNASVEQRIGQAFEQAGANRADDAFERLVPWIDEYTTRWAEQRTSACEDATVRGSWNDETLALSRTCFDQRKLDLQALLAILSEPDPDVVGRAVSAASKLSSIAPCRDVGWLVRRSDRAPTEGDEEIRRRLAHADILVKVDKPEQAREASTWVLDRLQERDDELRIKARIVHAEALELGGDFTRARRLMEEAFHDAIELGFDELAWGAADRLIWVVGYDQGNLERAREWGELARALGERTKMKGEPAFAAMLQNLAAVEYRGGNHQAALAHYEEALAIFEERLGFEHPDVGGVLLGLGSVKAAVGDLQEGRSAYERGLKLVQDAYGYWHRDVARATMNLGTLEYTQGNYEQALRRFDQAIEILEEVLGPDHGDLGGLHINRATALFILGRYEEAIAENRRAIEVMKSAVGPEHPVIASAYDSLGLCFRMKGDLEEAERLARKALQLREKVLGADHVDLAASLTNLGIVHRLEGELDQARADHQRALSIRMAVYGPDHPEVATSLNNLGNVEQDLGRLNEARGLHERAIEIQRQSFGEEHPDTAGFMLSLAGDLLKLRDHDGALAQYQRAFAIFEKTVGKTSSRYLDAMIGVGETHRLRGDVDESLRWLDRALEIARSTEALQGSLAEVQFSRAQTLWHSDREAARAQAQEALAAYEGRGDERMARPVRAWLRRH